MELAAFLEARNSKFAVHSMSRDFFVLSFTEKGNFSIDDLGGVIKIGELVANLPTETLRSAFLQKNREAQAQIARTIESSGA
ncbi:MAG: hypothetical protein QW166_01485, partial [Candidatus Bathyarchaeia archaeon]